MRKVNALVYIRKRRKDLSDFIMQQRMYVMLALQALFLSTFDFIKIAKEYLMASQE